MLHHVTASVSRSDGCYTVSKTIIFQNTQVEQGSFYIRQRFSYAMNSLSSILYIRKQFTRMRQRTINKFNYQ